MSCVFANAVQCRKCGNTSCYAWETVNEPHSKYPFIPSLFTLCRYGLSNCLFAATYDKILEECRCVPYFHTMAYDHYPVICSGQELTCMNAILRDIGSHTHVTVEEDGRNVTKPCLFACEDQGSKQGWMRARLGNLHS